MSYNLQQYKEFRESRKKRNYPENTDIVWSTLKLYVDKDTGEYIRRNKVKGYYPEYLILTKTVNYETKGRFRKKIVTYECERSQRELKLGINTKRWDNG